MGGIRAESRLSDAAFEVEATLDSGAKGAGSALSWLDVEATAAAPEELLMLVPPDEAGALGVDAVELAAGVELPAEVDPDPPGPDPLLPEPVPLDPPLVVVVVDVGSVVVLVPPPDD